MHTIPVIINAGGSGPCRIRSGPRTRNRAEIPCPLHCHLEGPDDNGEQFA